MISTDKEDDFLYNQIAERIEKQIIASVLKTGDKLPPVRMLSKEQGISLSTAYKAYSELEIKGLIEARPKSGYYVKYSRPKHIFSLPPPALPDTIEEAELDQLIAIVYKNMSDEGVVRLSMGAPAPELIPVAKLNKSMTAALRQSPSGCTYYENVQGNLLLRQHIARQAFNWGGTLGADDVITTNGCMEALVFCLKAVTRPGDTVAIETPTYFGLLNVLKSLGLKVLEIPARPDTGIHIDYLAQAISRVRVHACVFVPNFCNPSGSCMPDDHKKQLVQLLAAHHIPLIEDDIYGDMYFGKTRPRTCQSFDTNGMVLLCSSVSKTLAPGYRVGWCIPGKFKEDIIRIKLTHTVTSATPTQAAVALFFDTGRYDLHMRKLRKALHTQCLRYLQAVSDYFPAGIEMHPPRGGYVLWIGLDKSINAFRLYQAAMQDKISIAPGQLFSTDARFKNYIRISFGTPYNRKIESSLKLLGNLIKQEMKTKK